MAWKVEFLGSARRDMKRLDSTVRKRLYSFLDERVVNAPDPRLHAKPLTGPAFADIWSFRMGDYRMLARIQDQQLLVLIVSVEHRRSVYERFRPQ